MKFGFRSNALNIIEAAHFDPAPIDFVLPGFVRGTVGYLASPGGLGKSYFALEAAFAIAAPEANILSLPIERPGTVLYVSAEDDRLALSHRIHAIAQHISDAAVRLVAERLLLVPTVGHSLSVLDDALQDSIIDDGKNARLIVLDTFRRLHGEDENDNRVMTRVIDALDYIARKTGASVLFLHHTNKAAAVFQRGHEQQALRGSSVLSDNTRWGSYLVGMTEAEAEKLLDNGRPIVNPRAYVRFGISKINYIENPIPSWYRREAGGVLVPAQITATRASARKSFRVVREETVLETL